MDVAAGQPEDSMNPTKPKRDEYLDPKGYWIDPDRNIRRFGNEDGEQVAVLRATACCSDADGIGSTRRSSRASTPHLRKTRCLTGDSSMRRRWPRRTRPASNHSSTRLRVQLRIV